VEARQSSVHIGDSQLVITDRGGCESTGMPNTWALTPTSSRRRTPVSRGQRLAWGRRRLKGKIVFHALPRIGAAA